ncbi:hypothetical protein AAG570_004734 [Ranatra chinensis]|uniref:Peptidase S1 domain-containing protein n=1 Tax=Ranatra chinensis TaxID=642074 RepID=A0ABD0YEC2_9HEMI
MFCFFVSGRCVLPPVESEPYRILDCDGNTTSACTNPGGTLVDSNTAIQLTCQDGRTKLSHCVNGIWVPPPTCYKCGKTFDHSVAVDGDGLRREALPWHVALYKNNSGKFSPICGGGLITPNRVLTNAICVYQESTKKLYDLSEFKMAVGKFNWTWESHEASEQRRNVRASTENFIDF